MKLSMQRAFEDALQASDPTSALAGVVRGPLEPADVTHEERLEALEEFRVILRQEGRDSDEDIVLEVMDYLVGWASPHMSLAVDGDA